MTRTNSLYVDYFKINEIKNSTVVCIVNTVVNKTTIHCVVV